MKTCRRCGYNTHDLVEFTRFHLCKPCDELVHNHPSVALAKETYHQTIEVILNSKTPYGKVR